jgi:hypothetical protein
MKTYKRETKYKPPPSKKTTYIIGINTLNAAILKGIVAFFCSTKLYVFTFITIYINGVLFFITAVYVIKCAFLFRQTSDKPRIKPRCRSPPFPVRL